MPTVLKVDGYRFFFFSNEGNPREPVHIHVQKGGARAKIWLLPSVRMAYNKGFGAKELSFLQNVTEQHQKMLIEAWNEYFG